LQKCLTVIRIGDAMETVAINDEVKFSQASGVEIAEVGTPESQVS